MPFIIAEEYKVGKKSLNIKPMLKSFAIFLKARACKYNTLPAITNIEKIACTNMHGKTCSSQNVDNNSMVVDIFHNQLILRERFFSPP